MHRHRFGNRARDDQFVGTVDAIDLHIEIVIDDVPAGGDEDRGEDDEQQDIARQLLAEGELVEDRYGYPFLHEPYQRGEEEQIAPPHQTHDIGECIQHSVFSFQII